MNLIKVFLRLLNKSLDILKYKFILYEIFILNTRIFYSFLYLNKIYIFSSPNYQQQVHRGLQGLRPHIQDKTFPFEPSEHDPQT